jgi:hypothetical protein
MASRASALAALGLEPGADAAAVEQAYKKLIKQHHPDREGGDAGRAAEINRAYRELRGGKAATDPLQFNEDHGHRKRHSWPVAAAMVVAATAGVVLVIGPSVPRYGLSLAGAQMPMHHDSAAAMPEPMDEALHIKAIDRAVSQAVEIYRTKDEFALADASRDCQRRFRDNPGTLMLDRCAAFDDAAIGLQDRDPLRDEGPFAPLAVTGRQWSAASALSDDYLSIDTRLDRIRLRVELVLAEALAPTEPAPATKT